MLSAILILLAMPFTDLGRSRGLQFRPLSKIAFYIFIANFIILMVLGAKHVESPFIEFGQISTVLYFAHFLIIVPFISLLENSLVELDGFTTTTHSSNVILNSSLPIFNKIQKRSFSATTRLCMDPIDSDDDFDPNAPNTQDTYNELLSKRLDLERHHTNVVQTKSAIEAALNSGTRPEKVALATRLVEGDPQYSDRPVTRQTANRVLTELLEDQKSAIVNIEAQMGDADSLLESKKPR
jgi:Cytochrome b(C-terminal)/b6/petD